MQVLASIAGDTGTTNWQGIYDINSYVATAYQSLMALYTNFGLAGFDIDYEESIVSKGVTNSSWLQAWCQIVVKLKQVGPEGRHASQPADLPF